MSFPRFSLSSFVTLFSFQGTIFYIDFKFKQVCVQFAFSSTSSRTSVRKTEKKCEMCVKLFELVEMRRIELLSKQSPTRQRLQLFPSSYPKVLDGNKNSFGLAIVDSK